LHTPSDLSVTFDDEHAAANAGLLSEKLGLEELCDETISIAPFPGYTIERNGLLEADARVAAW
jgi:hypothetical protein